MKNLMNKKALPLNAVLHGEKYTYRIESLLRSDGYGFTYRAVMDDNKGENTRYVIVREHMMPHCSFRDEDGMTVVTPDDIAPTVESCRDTFIQTSDERLRISNSSPWLINVMETFPANGTYYYVVEYLEGQTLVEYIESNGGPISYEESRKLLSPVFDAIRTLHLNHVIHTDINPWHIRILKTKDGNVIPILFSLYCTLHFSDKGFPKWSLPVLNCQEGYAPPEQYGHIDHFCPQTDIYAIAATLVYVLSGKHLPDSRTITEQTIRETLPPTYPEMLIQAFINALNPDVSRRTASISQFRSELMQFSRSVYIPVRRKNKFDDMDDTQESDNSFLGRVKDFIKGIFNV